jgi:LuxR family maltose regulon positive regulatory protein
MLGSAGGGDDGRGEGAERAVLLATKLRVPAIGGEVVQRATLEHAYTDCQR